MASDIWVSGITKDGKVVIRFENDGAAYLRRKEVYDEEVTLAECLRRYPYTVGGDNRNHANRYLRAVELLRDEGFVVDEATGTVSKPEQKGD